MPELPEVEALARGLDTRLRGSRLARIDVTSFSVLKTPLPDISGARVRSVSRRGKFLVIDVQEHVLVLHLSRAGWLRWRDDAPAARPGKGPLALRVAFVDDDGVLIGAIDVTEAGTQKRVSAYVVSTPEEVPGISRLGPEIADLDAASFGALIRSAGNRQIKGVLRDQSVIAGIGNAYSDEVLHAGRLSPFAKASSLGDADLVALWDAVTTLLGEATDRAMGAESIKAEKRAGLRVHGRAGEPCPACGDIIREVSFADSSLQYCPACQTGGRPLADRRMSRLLR